MESENLDFHFNTNYKKDSEFLRDLVKEMVTKRKNEKVRKKGRKG